MAGIHICTWWVRIGKHNWSFYVDLLLGAASVFLLPCRLVVLAFILLGFSLQLIFPKISSYILSLISYIYYQCSSA